MTDGGNSTAPQRTDRPASQRKIEKILGAARNEFFANGFSATSIEGIAARAQVSKVTIYTWFQTKENLFGEVVKSECAHMHQNFVGGSLEGKNLRDVLIFAACSMLDFLTREEMVRFERVLASEVNRDPQIGEYFLDNGPRMLLGDLIGLLQTFVEKGEIRSDDLRASAEMLAGMVMGRMDLFLRYGEQIKLTPEEKTSRAERAVDAWLLVHRA